MKIADVHYVRIVTAIAGGFFHSGQDIGFASRREAAAAAEDLQQAFDQDADPKRAYVLDADRVPVAAASARRVTPLQSLAVWRS